MIANVTELKAQKGRREKIQVELECSTGKKSNFELELELEG